MTWHIKSTLIQGGSQRGEKNPPTQAGKDTGLCSELQLHDLPSLVIEK